MMLIVPYQRSAQRLAGLLLTGTGTCVPVLIGLPSALIVLSIHKQSNPHLHVFLSAADRTIL